MKNSFGESQAGVDKVEKQSDEIIRRSRVLANVFEQINLRESAAADPEEAEKLINEISKSQLTKLRNVSQKDWMPDLIDNND